MADKIVIKGIGRQVDGEYEFDASEFTMGDWRTIKQVSGVRPAEAVEALRTADLTFVVALAVVATKKPAEMFWAAKIGSLKLELDDAGEDEQELEVEADAGPPDLPSGPQPESDATAEPVESTTPSGETSTPSSESQETRLRAIGQ